MIVGTWRESWDQLSFSGGGLRCFWQGGALDVLCESGDISPKRIAAASGGALSACTFVAGCGDHLIERFCDYLEEREHNFEPNGDAEDIRDLTPHQKLYAGVVGDVLDEKACEAVANGPPMEVLLASPPDPLPDGLGAAVTMALYETDKAIRATPHGKLAEAVGAKEVRVDARKAAREGHLVDLVCLAATIPPVFEIRDWKGESVIDAGTVDNAPVPEPDEGCTLVLLTRSYRNLPELDRRTYIFPSDDTDASKIDFTDAEALRATYRQGREDMAALLERMGQKRG